MPFGERQQLNRCRPIRGSRRRWENHAAKSRARPLALSKNLPGLKITHHLDAGKVDKFTVTIATVNLSHLGADLF
jgi:hypothetical protein